MRDKVERSLAPSLWGLSLRYRFQSNESNRCKSKDMGIEFDANIGYEVTSGATLYAEGAFLKTGKFYENGGSQEIQNSSYVNFGLNYEL